MTSPAASTPSPTVDEGRELTRTQFIVAIAIEIAVCSKFLLPAGEPLRLARRAYHAFEDANDIAFGDPAFAWDQDAARTVAREYEIDHWEARL